jgi:hypothetical protein
VRGSGFCFPGRLIHLFVGGSELHGAKVDGTDDLDIYGVFEEPSEMVLGLESMPHLVWSTAGNDRANRNLLGHDKVLAMAQKLFLNARKRRDCLLCQKKWIGLLGLVFSPIVTAKLG